MILLAGVGYLHLSDLSFGPQLVERLRALRWPDDVQIEDLSYGPIAVLHWFHDHPGRFERAIFIGASERGRPPGTLTVADYTPSPRGPDDVQERIAEAVTGVISLDNLLIIAQHFGVLPARTQVIDLEPVALEWGAELSRPARGRLEQAIAWIEAEVGIGQRREVGLRD